MEDLEHKVKMDQFGKQNAKKNIMDFGVNHVKLDISNLTILTLGVNHAQMLLKTHFMFYQIRHFVHMNAKRD